VKANALQSSSDRTLHENSTQESKQPTVEENQSPEVASFPRSGSSCLKLLVSNNVAGSIIGKSGETILKLQRECGCRIKLSQAHDFFPGTSDRVCLLQGDNIDSVKKAVALILKKVRDVRVRAFENSCAQYLNPANGCSFLVRNCNLKFQLYRKRIGLILQRIQRTKHSS